MMSECGLSLTHPSIPRWVKRCTPQFVKRWNRSGTATGAGLGVATMPAQERVAITLRSTAQVLAEEIGDLSERLLGLGYAVIYLVLGV
jgi:hypothetical protein